MEPKKEVLGNARKRAWKPKTKTGCYTCRSVCPEILLLSGLLIYARSEP
jgi:hypothetical protein